MKHLFIILICFILGCHLTKGQESVVITSVDFVYCMKTFNKGLNNQIRTFSDINIDKPVNYSGFKFHIPLAVNRMYWRDWHMSFYKVHPQNISYNDIIYKLTGYDIGCSFGFNVIPKSEKWYLNLGYGFNVGNTKITEISDSLILKNPFFAPKILIQPRIELSFIAISIKAEYVFDISKYAWREKVVLTECNDKINNFNQTGLLLSMSIGVKI